MSASRVVVLLAAIALAAGAARGDDKLDADARQRYERGEALYKERRYSEARAEFAAGYELSRRAQFLFNMAECARLDHEPVVARQLYERYLTEAPRGELGPLARQRLASLPAPPAAPAARALPPPPAIGAPRSRAAPLALGLTAIAAIGGATAFYAWGESTYGKSLTEPDPAKQDALWHSANDKRHLAEGLAVAGAGCASVALWLYLRGDGRAIVAPAVAGDRVTLSLSGAF